MPSVDLGNSGDNTRIVYREFEGEAMFLGMMVQRGLRGKSMGERIANHFFEGKVAESSIPCETGFIHKPVIALTLGRVGLVPASTDFEVEILPRSKYEGAHEPKVAVLRADCDAAHIVEGSDAGRFYKVVAPEEVAWAYPINTPDMTVALHTRYLP